MFPAPLAEAGVFAASLETMGFQGMWTNETPHDPYLPIMAAAAATRTMLLGTGVATAFTRSPMVTALTAWDLQEATGGRFALGLGTQVPAHNARRYSTPADRPLARLRELVCALRHVWGAFQDEHRLDFAGDFYRLDLMTPMHSPGPIDHPQIPIYLAAVGPRTYRLAGELADGIHVHSFHTPEYLRTVALPALAAGLEAAERTRSEVTLVCSLFAIVGGDPRMDRAVRAQIAFYGSTTSYQPIFDVHGWGHLTDGLKAAVRTGDTDVMVRAIPDEVVERFAVVANSWADVPRIVEERYRGILDRVGFYALGGLILSDRAPEIARAFGLTRPPAGSADPVLHPAVGDRAGEIGIDVAHD
jgi:probable F420-dependent oxidoreductase